MNYFERQLDDLGAYAKYYFQEPSSEIDLNRIYPTIVICPGGAYFWTSFREDDSVALSFLAEGFHVVVVHYATEGLKKMAGDTIEVLPQHPVSAFPNPLVSLAKAVAFLKENAEEYHVDLDYVVVGGFSAGGNVAGQLGTLWHEDWLQALVGKDKEYYRPTHLLLAYAAFDVAPNVKEGEFNKVAFAATGEAYPSQELLDQLNPIKHVTHQTPPSFVWHTKEDVLVPATNALSFCQELAKADVDYELHLFNKGKHGLVLGDLRTGYKSSNQNAQVYKWVDLFLEWLYPIKTQNGGFYPPKEG
ncbi:alpha/beta hydrolase [Streptococcus pasteurianus]|uniref:alpha/beta hydrolase n=1 Tax=Streptococcus pasteurianus TaxID=197614 RepID=UPI0030136362